MARGRRTHHYIKPKTSPIAPGSDSLDTFITHGTHYLTIMEVIKSGAVDAMAITFVENTTMGRVFYSFVPRTERPGSFCTRVGRYISAASCTDCVYKPNTKACIYSKGQYAQVTTPFTFPSGQVIDPIMEFVYLKYLDCTSGK